MPVIEVAQKKEEKRLDEQIMGPGKYEVTKESKFVIDIYMKKVEDRWIIVQKSKDKDIVKEQVVFRLWSYDEMVEIRRKSNTYDSIKRMYWMDVDTMNRIKVQKLLLSWTFDKENPRLKIHHVGGVMTDESFLAFTKLQPNIARFIIEKMNDVLEYQ